eukprot:NODE_77_length_23338_cov_0.319463.p4 type:complete len:464 gc:universal NODE_77_length_23338_cov_0.319463:6068-7459(+)
MKKEFCMTPQLSDNKLTAIQFPGLVEDEENALNLMGGKSKITSLLANRNSAISLEFKRDHFSTKIKGHQVCVNYLLAELDEDLCCTIAGTIDHMVHFSEMADYHMDVEKDIEMDKLRSAIDSTDLDSIFDFDFLNHKFQVDFEPPPVFTNKVHPTEYQFKGQKFDKNKKSLWPKVLKVDFSLDDFLIPGELPLEDYQKHVALLSKDLQNLLQRTVNAFKNRPIMTSVCLANILDIHSNDSSVQYRYMKSKILPLVSYFIPQGPFRYCYAKLGFDPRDKPDLSKKFQVLDAASKKYKIRQNFKDSQPSHIFDGQNAKVYMIVHLCDVTDPCLHKLINDMECLPSYNNYGGFYNEIDFAAIKEIFRRRYANVALNDNNEIPESLQEAKLLNLNIAHRKKSSEPHSDESEDNNDDAESEDSSINEDLPEFEFDLDEIVGTSEVERNYVQANDLSRQVDEMLENMNF